MKNKKLITIFILLLIPFIINAKLWLPSIFSSHMVLQRDKRVPVWGRGNPGNNIVVKINGVSLRTKVDLSGKWKLYLPPMKAGGPYNLEILDNTEKIIYSDVMIGEVWLCSGQSNMWWNIAREYNIPKKYKPEENKKIRLFYVEQSSSDKKQDDFIYGKRQLYTPKEPVVFKKYRPEWKLCTIKNLQRFSALAYFFGKELQEKLKVPIGLIETSMGGATAEAWMSEESLNKNYLFYPIIEYWNKVEGEYGKNFLEFIKKRKDWLINNGNEKNKPDIPLGPANRRYIMYHPSGLYNAMLYPLIPYSIKGVIWYQGESSINRAWQYRYLFKELIRGWRRVWNQGNFPFIFVQLANYREKGYVYDPIPELREAQTMALKEPNTAMAVAIDTGETNVHSNNKWDIAHRLFLAALNLAYGKKIPFKGPFFKDMEIKNGKAIIKFLYTEGKLYTKDGSPPKGFKICGKNRVFYSAKTKILNSNTIIIWSDKVKKPLAVRYCWEPNPDCNLYNKIGLPAVPFRTDNFKLKTYMKLKPDYSRPKS